MTTPANEDGTTTDGQGTGEQVLGNTVDTTGAGGGTGGGGSSAPASNTDTTATGGAGSDAPAPAPPPVTNTFDTTTGTDTNPADNPAYNENPPTPTPVNTVDTTDAAYDVNSADDPAYRDPSGPVPASNADTRNPGGSTVAVNPGSPDAATVGGGDVNPNAAEPPITNSAYDTGGTRDTTGAGTNPNETFTPPGTLAAPINVSATAVAGRRAASVHWDAAPGTVPGSVDGYVIQGSTGGTLRVPANVRGAEVEEGLVGGQTYTFSVYAVNENGSGLRSTESNPVTIASGDIVNDPTVRPEYDFASAPGAPTGVAAVAGGRSATVTWVAPTEDGGDAILDYTVTASTGQSQVVAAGSTTASFASPSLTAGTAVTFTVTARNANGSSPASAASAAVTPTAEVPSAPRNVTATANAGGTATVTFDPPLDDGGAAITSYTATSAPGGFTATGAGSPLTVSGLVAGTAYTFTVTATNAAGTSAAGGPSNSVTALV